MLPPAIEKPVFLIAPSTFSASLRTLLCLKISLISTDWFMSDWGTPIRFLSKCWFDKALSNR